VKLGEKVVESYVMVDLIVFKTFDRNQAKWRVRWLKLGLSMCSETSSLLANLVLQSFPRESLEPDSIQICLTPCLLGSPKMILPFTYPNSRKRASQDPWTITEMETRRIIVCHCIFLINVYFLGGKHLENIMRSTN